MNMADLLDLYDHMAWADASVWEAVLDSEPALSDEALRNLLYHVQVVQRFFARVWRGEPLEAPQPAFVQTRAMYHWVKPYYGETRAYLESLPEALLDERMPEAWMRRIERLIGPSPTPTTVGESVMQVLLHSLYHRGQVNQRLREVGGTPPLVDYIAWVWKGRPAAVWKHVAEE